MINLIPPHGKTALSHEYILRVASVYAFLFSGVLLISTVLIFPTYVLLTSQIGTAVVEGSQVEEKKAAFDLAFEELRTANTLMAQLRGSDETTSLTLVITEVIAVSPEGIVFSSFSGAKEDGVLKSITIGGEAPTRASLAQLKTNLEASPLFQTANVPISDLAKESKLPFVISVILESTTPPSP